MMDSDGGFIQLVYACTCAYSDGVIFELHELKLSRNHLTRRIPPDIGQMRQLESLDLSHNMLLGQLPPSMS
ncbi:hypothetical protein SLEP1_g54764 [Rubroshorea leprosula]|uniref:Uncharacterized protein n=1 Tax=Rubroshorea leprosula TaxID=152421 RepID=A0AAV5ME04_9ROSI|nr:hypothetical protein SLEP1_g54764 [Rubroshorea leprosula]